MEVDTQTNEPETTYRMRHGWDSQYSEEQLKQLATSFYMYFNDERHEKRHSSKHTPSPEPITTVEWRMKDRLKTMYAVLAMCLNIGVDPPDILKTIPCARLECWIDPLTATSPSGISVALEKIGKALEGQYQQLSLRTKYRVMGDPIIDDFRKFVLALRKGAKGDRLLFHYNGHGVPKPTASGEIWVFNKDYTQYIPVALYDFQSWIGAPGIFVWDSNQAGMILKNFKISLEKHEEEEKTNLSRNPQAPDVRRWADTIQLAACREHELLPQTPSLPADLFTCCLTTPIEIGVRHFIMQSPLPSGMKPEDVTKIPGKAQERRTPVGELNWIFTAITDTIAWNMLPRATFKRLFRQDLMIAALFRNFLLAQRIMRAYGCHPMSEPPLPQTHDHPLWQSWDYAVDLCLMQLPMLTAAEDGRSTYQYKNSEFFAQQLTAFEQYLGEDAYQRKEPEQLPIVLQVLLSQVHRLRALVLLARFLDHGPWAVHLALSIGIFPYVSKLLQSQALELKPPLIFIWTRILAVDQSAQNDLLKDNEYHYFLNILQPNAGIYKPFEKHLSLEKLTPTYAGLPVREVSEHRAMCAFVLAMFCRQNRTTQHAALNSDLMKNCMAHVSFLDSEHPLLRQWSYLCLAMLFDNFVEGKWACVKADAHIELCAAAADPVPEVRAAMLLCISTLFGIPDGGAEVTERECLIMRKLLPLADDASSLVRKEMSVLLGKFAQCHATELGAVIRAELPQFLHGALPDSRARLHRISKKMTTLAQEKFEGDQASTGYAAALNRHRPRHTSQPSTPANRAPEESSTALSWERSVRFEDAAKTGGDRTPASINRSNSASTGTSRRSSSADENTRPEKSGHHSAKNSHKHQRQSSTSTVRSQLDGLTADAAPEQGQVHQTMTMAWKHIQYLAFDPDKQVAKNASSVVAYLTASALDLHTDRTPDEKTSPQTTQIQARLVSNLKQLQSVPKKTARTLPATSYLGLNWGPISRVMSFGRKNAANTSAAAPNTSKSSSNRSSMTITPPSTSSGVSVRQTQSTIVLPTSMANGLTSKPAHRATSSTATMLFANSGHKSAARQSQKPRSIADNAQVDMYRGNPQPNGAQSDTPHIQYSTPTKPLRLQDTANADVPIVTDDFFDISRAYFTKPQMQRPEGEETGSNEWRERRDYQARNEEILTETQGLKNDAGTKSWDRPAGVLNNMSQAKQAVFHQYDSHIAVVDPDNTIRIINWEKDRVLNTFHTGDKTPCSITAMKMINEDGHREGLLMTGANDGTVRLWGDYPDASTLVQKASFRAPNGLRPHTDPECKLVVDWIQSRGQILTVGGSKEVAVFSAAQEQYSHGISLGTSSPGKCMTTDPLQGDIVAVGFGNGLIRIYDQRQPPGRSMTNEWRMHASSVVNIHIQRGGQRELASATADGWVNTWDIRMQEPLLDVQVAREGLSHMILHEHAPTFAIGSRSGGIRIYNVASGAQLGSLKTVNGKRVDPVPPVALMAYHPHKMIMAAAAAGDTHAWLYTLR